jgi:hypothetical protein
MIFFYLLNVHVNVGSKIDTGSAVRNHFYLPDPSQNVKDYGSEYPDPNPDLSQTVIFCRSILI